ncbi:MAG: glutamine synthetase, partial [Muribaculaceae bacterium]|nr:glutamine synthetase [Muribaculaceae bacterium]
DVDRRQKQTFEIRSADGSADLYQLLAGLAVAVRHGFSMPDALETAGKYYVDIDIHRPENAARLNALPTLPATTAASADCLESRADVFTEKDIFTPGMIQAIAARLRSFDTDEAARALKDPELMLQMVNRYFHCG